MYFKSEIAFTLNIGLEVSHLKVIIDPINNEIGKPWILSTGLEEFVE